MQQPPEWRAPGFTLTNLVPDTYFVEFRSIDGFAIPETQVVQIYAAATRMARPGIHTHQPRPRYILRRVPVHRWLCNSRDPSSTDLCSSHQNGAPRDSHSPTSSPIHTSSSSGPSMALQFPRPK